MFKMLSFAIVIELGDNNSVTAMHYGFVDVIQDYQVEALHTSTFQLSLLQSTKWIWWAYDYISEHKNAPLQSSLPSTYDRLFKSTCFLCSKCTFDCHNAQSASRPSTSNGSLECQSSTLRSAIRDAAWICQTYARCRRQQNIVKSSSPQLTSIWMLCQ
jgi:hypothetical protein